MKGLTGTQGRRVCDRQMQGNMIAVCKVKFGEGSQELSSCLSTAETMFTAVYTIQESLGGQLDNSHKCPGQVSKLSIMCQLFVQKARLAGCDACCLVYVYM
jgi:hypothetical protein